MLKQNPAIVIVAYNRPHSLLRLLTSLYKANYPNKNITLIISIDKGAGNDPILAIAKDFIWNYGTKIIKYQEQNLGLRKHILQCGGYSDEYGAIIVLEDDLYVSPNFYNYSLAAIKHTQDDEQIGGISLYNHQMNVHTRDNFNALNDGFDNWFFQFASSWGQVWTKLQWHQFITWYNANNTTILRSSEIPSNVTNWSDKSWLKYYIVYLIQTKKYFFYPRTSLTTNFSDQGTHVEKNSTAYQVPLDFSTKKFENFSSLSSSASIYDAFYENENLSRYIDLDKNDICIDLYGYKNRTNERFWLTSRILDYKIIRSFGQSLKPMDANIRENIEGSDIFLYDTDVLKKNTMQLNRSRRLIYNIKHISYQNALHMFLKLFNSGIRNKLKL